jgi:hypothetical protein
VSCNQSIRVDAAIVSDSETDAQIYFGSTDENGHPIRSSYRVVDEIIHVKLSDGTTSEASLGSTPTPTIAKIILHDSIAKDTA